MSTHNLFFIDCGYSLEPHHYVMSRNKKKMYTPVNPSFFLYKSEV